MAQNKPTFTLQSKIVIFLIVITIPILIALFILLKQPTLTPVTPENSVVLGVEEYRGTIIEPPMALEDFSMPASTGETLSLSDLRGKWVLLFFGFTHCPDICPMTLTEHRRVMNMLGDDAEKLQVVLVSVDAERDTPDVLKTYVTRFNPTFIGLQGLPETLEQIQQQFGLWYEFVPQEGDPTKYSVDHSARTYLIDPDGNMRITYSFGTEPEILAETIQEAIRQG